MHPSFRFIITHPVHFISCGFGSGLSRIAPGTAGTLAAWILFPFLRPHFSEAAFLLFLAAGFAIGVWTCHKTGKALGVPDHGAIVWDEIIAFWLVLFMTPSGFGWQFIAFFLFRGFDIFKPFPAGWIDHHLKNGFGVMLDDVVAGLYSVLGLALLKFLTKYTG